MSEQGWRDFVSADGIDDWVVLHGGPTAVFRVGSLVEAARLYGRIGEPTWKAQALLVLGAHVQFPQGRHDAALATLDEALAGENVGVLLRGIEKNDVERGMVLAAPGTCAPHTKFKGTVYVLNKDEGGRHKPFFTGYRPQFYFRTTDVTGTVELPQGTEMVMPGDNVEITAELINPIAMEEGMRFAIREGGKTIGAGTVSKILK